MDEKKCLKCLLVLPVGQFYVQKPQTGLLMAQCKECVKSRVKKRYYDQREKIHAYEQVRSRQPARRAKAASYLKDYRKRNPKKNSARRKVAYAILTGRLVKMPCCYCGSLKSQAHHTDYDKPLDVSWCCFKCHREREHGQVVISDFL